MIVYRTFGDSGRQLVRTPRRIHSDMTLLTLALDSLHRRRRVTVSGRDASSPIYAMEYYT